MATYHALYEIDGEHFWRPFQADDLPHAVDQAVDATEDGEHLCSVLLVKP